MQTIEKIHELFLECNSIQIDTRKILKNDMFIAIKGDRYDANTFTQKALELGAKYVVIDNPDYYIDHRTILVENTLLTIQNLAKFHRKHLNLPIIALTGSNGKTTTKELIREVLTKKFNTKATLGNLNNHIGVPLTILSFDNSTEIGIVEMGANHQKEIEFLCDIAQPDFGYITNFGKAHLEGFGGAEGVIKGKSEMYEYLIKNNKIAFINADDSIQTEKTKFINTIGFSFNNNVAEHQFSNLKANPFVELTINYTNIYSNLIGLYNANNIAAAISIGLYFNIDINKIKEAIEDYTPTNNRSQIIEIKSNQIILDAYNANPSSMEVATQNFLQLNHTNKWMILGDMFELGNESLNEHKYLVNKLSNIENCNIIFIGKDFYSNKIEKDNLYFFDDFEQAKEFIMSKNIKNTSLLIKGSRGMALERVLEFI